MAGGCLVGDSRRQCTSGHYPQSGHYLGTKARRYVAMATCLETVTAGCSSADQGNKNNHGFGVCFSYKMLNVVINNSDFIILGLTLLIYS